ncbi:MAG TPA: hydrogenase-4 component E [Candidatus Avidesulfovibrio excrementigallinarum]|nr:hydrogenase-4 component E [Candidatus Avidesulfovibrio excrementigallinarum]
MSALFQFLLILLMLNNLALAGVSRLRTLIRQVSVQGVLLALLLMLPGAQQFNFEHLLLAIAVLLIKGIGFPILLRRTLGKISGDPQVEPWLSCGLSVLACMAGLAFSLWFEGRLPIQPGLFPSLLLPAALMTLFCGLILVVGRRKALSQVIGYLIAENGIFLLGIPLMSEETVWFELTILLDVFVAVFVMGIAINHISKTFESIDVGRFCSLRD